MSTVTIADRRAITTAAAAQPDFSALLRRDPRAAFHRATGREAPASTRISVVEESAGAWEFVVPAGPIDADLPEAADARGVIENNVYSMLRNEPEVRTRAISDPRAFLAERLAFDIGEAGVTVHEEQPGELVLILPHGDSRDELNEAALDLVAGGGNDDDDQNFYPGQKSDSPKRV